MKYKVFTIAPAMYIVLIAAISDVGSSLRVEPTFVLVYSLTL